MSKPKKTPATRLTEEQRYRVVEQLDHLIDDATGPDQMGKNDALAILSTLSANLDGKMEALIDEGAQDE